jgi:hypothetical protein
MPVSDNLKLYARWTDDCQGKKDYDGPIISISTRYWPRGGGFHLFNSDHPQDGFQGNETRPEVKPSATCSLVIRHGEREDGGGGGDWIKLISKEFEGDTFESIKLEVEAFAQAQMDRVVEILKGEYAIE